MAITIDANGNPIWTVDDMSGLQFPSSYATNVATSGGPNLLNYVNQFDAYNKQPDILANSTSSVGTPDTYAPQTYTPETNFNYANQYNDLVYGMENDLDTQINELLGIAQGDYDFAAKWLENEYKIALGNDDQERKQFLKQVANALEQKIGTVAYDYKTGKYRTEQDKEIALNRLAEDEKVIRKQYEQEDAVSREEQNASLNQRGIMSGTRDTTEGLGSKFIDRLEQQIQDKELALNRSLARTRGDIELGTSRRLEDLATTARRDALGTQFSYDYNTEANQRALDRKKRDLENKRLYQKKYEIPTLASSLISQGYNFNG